MSFAQHLYKALNERKPIAQSAARQICLQAGLQRAAGLGFTSVLRYACLFLPNLPCLSVCIRGSCNMLSYRGQDLWYTTDASLRSTATEHCHQAIRVAGKHFSCYAGRGKQHVHGDQECTAAAAKSASAREAGDSETPAVAPAAAAAFDPSARGKLCCSLHDAMWRSRLLGFIVLIHLSTCACVT